MKSYPKCCVALAATVLLLTSSARADEAAYAAVIKERDQVLSEILSARESRRATGTADEESIAAAQLALYSFRRDAATATGEQIKQQELIVRLFEKKLEITQAKTKAGLVGNIEVLEARAPLLEARQRLEELRLKEKR